jgi:hypothetical protein
VTGVAELGQLLSLLLLTAFVFLLPLMDQIIAYPKWQQMCATTGDFEWGTGIDEEKAFGRELIVFGSIHCDAIENSNQYAGNDILSGGKGTDYLDVGAGDVFITSAVNYIASGLRVPSYTRVCRH